MTKILTISGREVDPFEMTAVDIDIMDIAHSLSMQCRYAGHVPTFYSVDEHCVRATELMQMGGQLSTDDMRNHATARAILLHDAEEAYLQDLVSPVKNRPGMAEYRAAGDRLHAIIAEKYDAPAMVKDHRHHHMVTSHDQQAYEWERAHIRAGSIAGLHWEDAKSAFLGMWYLVRPSTFG